jgi:hypothetical protein
MEIQAIKTTYDNIIAEYFSKGGSMDFTFSALALLFKKTSKSLS